MTMTEYEIKQARAIANLVTGVEGFTRVCTQTDLRYLARAVLDLSEQQSRSTVTPEQVEAAAKDLSGLVNHVQLWDKFEEDDRRYWRAKVQIVARWFGLSVAEDGK